MRPVKWELYRKQENGEFKLISKFNKHTTVMQLEPGIYFAQAELGDVKRTRVFDTNNTFSNSVLIAMD